MDKKLFVWLNVFVPVDGFNLGKFARDLQEVTYFGVTTFFLSRYETGEVSVCLSSETSFDIISLSRIGRIIGRQVKDHVYAYRNDTQSEPLFHYSVCVNTKFAVLGRNAWFDEIDGQLWEIADDHGLIYGHYFSKGYVTFEFQNSEPISKATRDLILAELQEYNTTPVFEEPDLPVK